MFFVSHGDRIGLTVFPQLDRPPQRIVVHLDINAAVTDAVACGAGVAIDPGYITPVDNDALAALNLLWEQVAMVLPDQRVTDGFPRAALLRPRDTDGQLGRPQHLTLHHATLAGAGRDTHGTMPPACCGSWLRVDRPTPPTTPAGKHGVNISMRLQYGARDHDHVASVDPEVLLRTLQVLDTLDHTTGLALTLHGSSS